AELYFNLKDYVEALDFYKKSLELVSVKDMPGIQLKIAEVLQAEGKTSEAIEEYLKVTYLYSDNNVYLVKALLRVAEIYEGMDNFKEAINIYNRIVSMNVEEAKYAKERLEWIKEHVK
ncbi:MAG: tetratricopeptide repeat protein, partial [Candidatus Omnitrophica bacterium]|nr:tetratricopeptide repeat protein [Candidatus Omnitrophota bacterium]